jgi:hypothetical protein
MSIFTYTLEQKIADFNGTQIRVLNIHIEIDSGKIPIRAEPLILVVTDGGAIAQSWSCQVSGNQKEADAWFTTDAFNGFSTNAQLAIGFADELMQLIEDVDITAFPPPPTTPGVTDATNAWLQNVIANQ